MSIHLNSLDMLFVAQIMIIILSRHRTLIISLLLQGLSVYCLIVTNIQKKCFGREIDLVGQYKRGVYKMFLTSSAMAFSHDPIF